eukprot:c27343_g1_i1 orf=1147-3000(-)
MGSGGSKEADSSLQNGNCDGSSESGGWQLYVSLKMQIDDCKLSADLVPHVYGSAHMVGSWDATKALTMERETISMWEISFVAPSDHETLDFKFLLKPRYGTSPCIIEEGSKRLLCGGNIMDRDAGSTASFRLLENSSEIVEFHVYVQADRVSPFALAASWRAYKENLQSHGSMVRGIPDVSINSSPTSHWEGGGSHALELDLEHYEVPTPALGTMSKVNYVADGTEDPRYLSRSSSLYSNSAGEDDSPRMKSKTGLLKDRSLSIKDLLTLGSESLVHVASVMIGESKLVRGQQALYKSGNHQGLYVERGVGSSPRPICLGSDINSLDGDLKLDTEPEDMPKASGAVAAAAVADRMLGPKENRQLAIILVGLPARGKTFTAAKLTRYLRWLGHDTKHFNVGKYRRIKHGSNQTADFFRADNQEGVEARNEVAALAMEDMLAWMKEGGQVGIFDATNSTRRRRNMLMKIAEGKCKVIFLETICNDQAVLDRNIRLKIQQSPDYADETDYNKAREDFKARLANYEKVYEPVEEGSYIKMIDMATGQGGQMQVNHISGYLPGRIVFFLVNTHITPKPILLTRHGESRDNVRGRIGGDSDLSEPGEKYSKKTGRFCEQTVEE